MAKRPTPQSQKPAVLRAVLFDLDNTLVDRDRAFLECLSCQGVSGVISEELMRLDCRGYGDRARLFAAWSQHCGTAMNQQLFGEMLARRILPDSELLHALGALSRTVKLGIISNGGGSTQRGKWRAAGLESIIPAHHVWVSEELGFAKPDPRIFLQAAAFLGEAPGDCLYLGDHQENDVRGALAAGMRARLVTEVLTANALQKILTKERTQ